MPALVVCTQALGEPRYPSLKGIMAARSKTIETRGRADLAVEAGRGRRGRVDRVLDAEAPPPARDPASSASAATWPRARSWRSSPSGGSSDGAPLGHRRGHRGRQLAHISRRGRDAGPDARRRAAGGGRRRRRRRRTRRPRGGARRVPAARARRDRARGRGPGLGDDRGGARRRPARGAKRTPSSSSAPVPTVATRRRAVRAHRAGRARERDGATWTADGPTRRDERVRRQVDDDERVHGPDRDRHRPPERRDGRTRGDARTGGGGRDRRRASPSPPVAVLERVSEATAAAPIEEAKIVVAGRSRRRRPGGLRARRGDRGRARRRGRGHPGGGRRRLDPVRPADRPDRQDRQAAALPRARNQRRDPAQGRACRRPARSSPSTATRTRRSPSSPTSSSSATCSRSAPRSSPSSALGAAAERRTGTDGGTWVTSCGDPRLVVLVALGVVFRSPCAGCRARRRPATSSASGGGVADLAARLEPSLDGSARGSMRSGAARATRRRSRAGPDRVAEAVDRYADGGAGAAARDRPWRSGRRIVAELERANRRARDGRARGRRTARARGGRELEAQTSIKRGYLNLLHAREATSLARHRRHAARGPDRTPGGRPDARGGTRRPDLSSMPTWTATAPEHTYVVVSSATPQAVVVRRARRVDALPPVRRRGRRGSSTRATSTTPATIRRRRECAACATRFTTYERVEAARLIVVKRDGVRQEFDRDKLAVGLRKALTRRPVAGRRRRARRRRDRGGAARGRASTEVPSRPGRRPGDGAAPRASTRSPTSGSPASTRASRTSRSSSARSTRCTRSGGTGPREEGAKSSRMSVLSDRDIRAALEAGRVRHRPVRPARPPAVVGRPPPRPQRSGSSATTATRTSTSARRSRT